jgi:hypothetical protein
LSRGTKLVRFVNWAPSFTAMGRSTVWRTEATRST